MGRGSSRRHGHRFAAEDISNQLMLLRRRKTRPLDLLDERLLGHRRDRIGCSSINCVSKTTGRPTKIATRAPTPMSVTTCIDRPRARAPVLPADAHANRPSFVPCARTPRPTPLLRPHDTYTRYTAPAPPVHADLYTPPPARSSKPHARSSKPHARTSTQCSMSRTHARSNSSGSCTSGSNLHTRLSFAQDT